MKISATIPNSPGIQGGLIPLTADVRSQARGKRTVAKEPKRDPQGMGNSLASSQVLVQRLHLKMVIPVLSILIILIEQEITYQSKSGIAYSLSLLKLKIKRL